MPVRPTYTAAATMKNIILMYSGQTKYLTHLWFFHALVRWFSQLFFFNFKYLFALKNILAAGIYLNNFKTFFLKHTRVFCVCFNFLTTTSREQQSVVREYVCMATNDDDDDMCVQVGIKSKFKILLQQFFLFFRSTFSFVQLFTC